MNITNLGDGLTFSGEVVAVRQTYYVFEATDCFWVMSFSPSKPGAGNFNVVDKRAVPYVHKRFERQRNVTSNAVVKGAGRTSHAPDSLTALNILYVLVATGSAKVEKVGPPHSQLFFRVFKV